MLEETVPIELLDRFYFEQVVGQMPDPIKSLAVDLRLLRGESARQYVTTLNHLYANEYLFIPWLLDDIFDISDETRLTIGQAWILTLLAYVMLDQIVDRQMPDVPTVPLVQQHLLFKANEVLASEFKTSEPFWGRYYDHLYEYMGGLALESECLDAHAQAYTYEVMQKVCIGKAAPFRLFVHAMALRSGNTPVLEQLNKAFNNLIFAEQLNNDMLDCRKDYKAARYTLPVFMALEVEGDTLETASRLSIDELDARIQRYAILVDVAEKALFLLQDAQANLMAIDLQKTKLYRFINKRIKGVERHKQRFQVIRLLNGLANLITTD